MEAFDELLRPLVAWIQLLNPWAELAADVVVSAMATLLFCGLLFVVGLVTLTTDLVAAAKYIAIVGPIAAALLLFDVYVVWVVVGWWGFVYSAAYLGITGWGMWAFNVNKREEMAKEPR